ncbi:MAG TPA: hypothetical protein VLF18_00055 [Tahibacter sp.]|uniref:hypothetical protein n=1 Tax=Tahibacter sp. TaxID=2056211 RepID=UPI002C7E779B|nr:hypothetical protein [Tahibacter sp.]HSX58563.1 hypothetical protein [Tahibacter sp.]
MPAPAGTPAPLSALSPWRAYAAISLASALCGIVAWRLVGPGPFDWAIAQPAFWQGGLEATALLAGLALAQRFAALRWRVLASLLLIAFYARRHAIDAPLLLCVAYLEITLALGAAVLRVFRQPLPQRSEDHLRSFVLGLSAWSVVAWTSCAFGYGTPVALRVLTLLLLPAALWARSRPLSVHLLQRAHGAPLRERMLLAALAGWVLVLFARTNTAFSFDGLWYGLRPEYVLSADGSPFASLGLVSPVHYFPKLYEVWLLPLSALDASVVCGMTILLLVLLALAVVRLLARLGVESLPAQIPLAALVLTLPAIANPAIEPKPDLICALMLMLACLFGGDAVRRRDAGALAWALAAALLAVSSKLVAVPYLGLLAVTAAIALWRLPTQMPAGPSSRPVAATALVLALAAAAFVAARTWLLAGLPTIGPDPLFKLWLALGFELREPAGTLVWAFAQDWSDVPALVVDWLLRPDRLEHIAISWTGNVWLWLPLAAVLLRPRRVPRDAAADAHRLLLGGLIVAGIVIATGWRYHTRGSDGNYFIAALVPALTLGVAFAWRQLCHAAPARRLLQAILLGFAAFQGIYAFASASWAPGTRAFDLVLDRSPRDSRKIGHGIVAYAGLDEIAEYLRVQPGVARVVGCAPFEAAARLPARFEDFPSVALSRPEYVSSLAAATQYMRRFGIRYLLLPKPRSGEAAELIDGCTPQTAAPAGTRIVVENDRFLLAELVADDSG